MKYLIISFLLSVLFLFSCEEKKVLLIPEEEMIDILVDIHLSDGVLNTESFPYDNVKLRPENYYKNVLNNHHITRAIFDSALSQYTENRELYITMYDKVIEELRTKQSLIQAKEDVDEKKGALKELFSYSYSTGYEDAKGFSKIIQKSFINKESHNGKHSYEVKGGNYTQSYHKLMQSPVEEIKFDVKCFLKVKKKQENYPMLAFILQKDKKIIAKQYIKLDKFIKKIGAWNEVKVSSVLSLETPESDIKISTYFFNPKKTDFFVDDYSLEIKQIK